MPRSRPSTPPRSSRNRALPATKTRASSRTRSVSVRTRRPHRSGSISGAFRFLIIGVAMAVLGFALVFIADGLDRIVARQDDVGGLIDKIVDRLLDRDVPRMKTPAEKKTSSTKAPVAPKATPTVSPNKPDTGGEKPASTKPSTPRGDLPTVSPETYARDTAKAPTANEKTPTARPSNAKPSARDATAPSTSEGVSKKRLDDLVKRVTGSL